MSNVPEEFAIGVLQRRAPYGDSPEVGERGTRTQQRILKAALAVFDEVGYHDGSIDRITARASCSRPSFYQYFSTKEDLFRHLSGDLSRRIYEITSSMDRVTPDQQGWESIHQWVVAYGEIYDLFRPVFVAFSTVVAEDTAVRIGAQHVFDRQAQDLLSKIDRRAFRVRRPEVVIALLLHTVPRTLRYRHLLGGTGDRIGAIGRQRVEQALSDVLHRALFGQIPGINVRTYPLHGSFAPRVAPRAADQSSNGLTAAGLRTQAKLLEAGRKVITVRGYHEARVDDIVELADASHGTFYRYFDNKEGLFRVLAAQSRLSLASAVDDLPAAMAPATTPGGSAPLRQWVAHYLEVFGREGPVLKAWFEGLGVDPDLRSIARDEIESLWIRLAGFLAPFGVGDVDADALVMLSLLDRAEPTGVSGPIDPAVVGAFTRIFVQSFLLQDVQDVK